MMANRGIRFQVDDTGAGDLLPRMDIAHFVGFAQAGPSGIPVAVSSLGEFETIFGKSFPLALDERTGERIASRLHGAAGQFFANGGRRLWITRVLDENKATRSVFGLPAMVRAELDGNWKFAPVALQARHPGSWSDDLRISTSLVEVPFSVIEATTNIDGSAKLKVSGRLATDLVEGDVLKVDLEAGRTVHLPVVSAEFQRQGGGGVFTVTTSAGVCSRSIDLKHDGARKDPRAGFLQASSKGVWKELQRPVDVAWRGDRDLELGCEADPEIVPRQGCPCRLRWRGFPSAWAVIRDARTSTSSQGKGRNELRVDVRAMELADTGWIPKLASRLGDEIRHVDRIRLKISCRGPHGSDADAIVPLADPWLSLPSTFPVMPFASAPGFGSAGGFLLPLDDEPQTFPPTAPFEDSTPRLSRDGLASFSSDLFVDPLLVDCTTSTLHERAQELSLRTTDERSPRGLHAFVARHVGGPSEEATMIAAPDAAHRRWYRTTAQPEWWIIHPVPTAHSDVSGEFHPCVLDDIEHPRFVKEAPPAVDGTIRLRWTISVEGGEFELQESVESAEGRWATIFQGAATLHVRRVTPGRTRWFRVRSVLNGEAGAWSHVAEVRSWPDEYVVPALDRPPTPLDVPDLVGIHRVLLRIAAARGDSLALLSLPRETRWSEAVEFTSLLRSVDGAVASADPEVDSPVHPWTPDDQRSLSFGMLSHPWIRTSTDLSIPVPPEGSVAGLFAQVSLEGRPWIAPGNRAFVKVVATELECDTADLDRIQDARICAIPRSADGFCPAWFETLSEDPDLGSASVRRFLGMLRRLVVRHGADSVFEPGGRALERSIERTFRRLLESLWSRGALRGTGEGSSYRVDVVTESDQGRVRVDLRVAPSLPLSFLLVTLRSSGERLMVEEKS